jgi:hypothetical protein
MLHSPETQFQLQVKQEWRRMGQPCRISMSER